MFVRARLIMVGLIVGAVAISSGLASAGSQAFIGRSTRDGRTVLPYRMPSGFPAFPVAPLSGASRFGAGAAVLARNASTPPRLPWAAPAVPVGVNPVGVAVDAATHTVYVANGLGNTVSVIDEASCNAMHVAGCGRTPTTVPVGDGPLSIALDHKNHTAYVTNLGDNTVSMINEATCNAHIRSGCSQTPPTVAVGNTPTLLAVDQATDTVYVANYSDNTVSVINGATCNATTTSGCAQTPPTVNAGAGPSGVAFDPATHTVYVPNFDDNTVSVIDGAICNASVHSGCGQTPATVAVGISPSALAIDEAHHTVYVINGPEGDETGLGSVAMIDTATCNATISSGCGQTPPMAPVGSVPIWVAVNPLTHSVYVVNQEDSSVSVLNAATCNATSTLGCAKTPPAMAIGFDGGGVDVDPTTNTIYASSQETNSVSVLNGATCNAGRTSGCTQFAPTTTIGTSPAGIGVDETTNTVYVGNRTDNTVSVIDAASCNPSRLSGCDHTWPTVSVGTSAQNLAVNQRTDTIYVANTADDTVSVINGKICNARHISGCSQTPTTVAVGEHPYALAINENTNTVYVANIDGDNVSVISGVMCNSTDTSGCGQAPSTLVVGHRPDWVAIDQATDTVYVVNNGGSVSVIDGATCNARVHSGCGQIAQNVGVGNFPIGMAIAQATSTIYVVNAGDDTLSLINGEICNAHLISGCGRAPRSVAVGGFPFAVAVDQAADKIYVTSIVDSDVEVIDGASCNAMHTEGCHPTPVPARMGGWPTNIVVDNAVGSFYVPQNVDGAVSFFRLSRRTGWSPPVDAGKESSCCSRPRE
jgi:YVTN family beta-propeller protein